MVSIVWFRQDLRLADNPALVEAARNGEILPVFILDVNDRPLGGASKWWLHESLIKLSESLGGLVLKKGDPEMILQSLAAQSGADAVYWNRSYEPYTIKRDKKIKTALQGVGLTVKSFHGSVIYEPWQIQNNSGSAYKVYSPFWRAMQAKGIPAPLPASNFNIAPVKELSDALEDLALHPENPDWARDWKKLWQPGENGAMHRVDSFFEDGIKGYGELRNRPDLPNVSRLSPHIHYGEISPRQLFAKAQFIADQNPALAKDIQKFKSEIAWRDFAIHLMYHFPTITEKNWKPAFDVFPWRQSEDDLKAWKNGKTGYPMVDAGLRELWHTGFMHNRVRMLVASFLVKHLRIHWLEGEAWFWDTLLDADMANNTASWQWVTGSGADAAPYFRIFSPISQGPKFDPNGEYVRKWCPELAKLPNALVHTPFEASDEELAKAGIILGETYPKPIVDHKKAREAALSGYEKVKQAG
ncbi:MAG: deoxyribodipyrimidine photo-lyase [Pseudomonadota bacterium]